MKDHCAAELPGMLKSLRSRVVLFTFSLLAALQGLDVVWLAIVSDVGLDDSEWLMIKLGLLGVLFGTLAAYPLARLISAPLTRLTRAALQLERGDFETPIAGHGPAEVDSLANSLEHMRIAVDSRQQEMIRLAYHDMLTNLPNRSGFTRHVDHALQSVRNDGSHVSVLLMDLDRFREINETLGHHFGDQVLSAVARRLSADVAPGDVLARLGGDEFGMLVRSYAPDRVHMLARETLRRLEEPLIVSGQPVDVRLSIGIASFPADGATSSTLLQNADIALYAAKRQHSGFAVFDSSTERNRGTHLSLLGELRRAITDNQLRLVFQPKLDLETDSVPAVEALVRWEYPERGTIPPGEFIPFAEQSGYIRPLTNWVLQAALRQSAQWRRDHDLNVQVAVNIAARDLTGPDLTRRVAELLRVNGVPPRLLCLEITESGVMNEPELARQVLVGLSELGVRLAIDDYGTGYSSLSYIMQLPVNELKIDQSFVFGMARDRHADIIVRSTIDMGRSLGLTVVAEGVDHKGALHRLRKLQCDHVQGNFVSVPLPPDELVRWIDTHRQSRSQDRSSGRNAARR
jgi:diguanylate cyclase (GGDEF)-like protein